MGITTKRIFSKEDLKIHNTMGTIVLYNNYTVLKKSTKMSQKIITILLFMGFLIWNPWCHAKS